MFICLDNRQLILLAALFLIAPFGIENIRSLIAVKCQYYFFIIMDYGNIIALNPFYRNNFKKWEKGFF